MRLFDLFSYYYTNSPLEAVSILYKSFLVPAPWSVRGSSILKPFFYVFHTSCLFFKVDTSPVLSVTRYKFDY